MILAMTVLLLSPQSPYAGQEQRGVKALSPEEVRGYLEGEGMGYAKAAELNRYPGPRHVLEHAPALGLSEPQLAEVRRIHQRMHEEAVRLGLAIVEKEKELDGLFVSGLVRSPSLDNLVTEIALLQGRLRAAHLRAHLETRAVLSAEQVRNYDKVRGYHLRSQGAGHPH